MRPKLWVSVVILFVSATLAGCAGPKMVANVAGGGPNSTPVFDDNTGAIRGLVLTEEELPIAGATAGILSLGAFASSDADGLFALNQLAPGEYDVQVLAMGFKQSSTRVKVEAGEATDLVEVRLEQDLSDVPYSRSLIFKAQLSGLMWKLTPTCIYEPLTTVNPLLKTCGGVRLGAAGVGGNDVVAGCSVCETHTSGDDFKLFNANWQTIIGEVEWQAQSGATGKGYLFDLNAPNITRGTNGAINQADPYTFKVASNKAPIAVRVDKDALAARGIKEKDFNNYNSTEDRCTGDNPSTGPNFNCDWFFRLFPAAYDAGFGEEGFGPDYGLMLESTATIYLSYFIREKAAADYTALV